MTSLALKQLIPVIQTAIGPVILISGVGLLLLSLTNRLGRIVDRSRSLARELPGSAGADRPHLAAQLPVLYRRARILRLAISLSTTSVLLAALLIIVLFLGAVAHWEVGPLVTLCFILCMATLIASLLAFLLELQTSLRALHMELIQAGLKEE